MGKDKQSECHFQWHNIIGKVSTVSQYSSKNKIAKKYEV